LADNDRQDQFHRGPSKEGQLDEGQLKEGQLTHFDNRGRAQMVEVSDKGVTRRTARARGRVSMLPETLELILGEGAKKGDVLAVAEIAGIMAAKRAGDLIPLCHPLTLTGVRVRFLPDRDSSSVHIEAEVKTDGKTGVEMEALTAVSVAALTIYDMCKAVDRFMEIHDVRLVYKSGGQSGEINREGEFQWPQD